jgi:hypothetical protein
MDTLTCLTEFKILANKFFLNVRQVPERGKSKNAMHTSSLPVCLKYKTIDEYKGLRTDFCCHKWPFCYRENYKNFIKDDTFEKDKTKMHVVCLIIHKCKFYLLLIGNRPRLWQRLSVSYGRFHFLNESF